MLVAGAPDICLSVSEFCLVDADIFAFVGLCALRRGFTTDFAAKQACELTSFHVVCASVEILPPSDRGLCGVHERMLDGPWTPLVSISECLMDASGLCSRYMLVGILFGRR